MEKVKTDQHKVWTSLQTLGLLRCYAFPLVRLPQTLVKTYFLYFCKENKPTTWTCSKIHCHIWSVLGKVGHEQYTYHEKFLTQNTSQQSLPLPQAWKIFCVYSRQLKISLKPISGYDSSTQPQKKSYTHTFTSSGHDVTQVCNTWHISTALLGCRWHRHPTWDRKQTPTHWHNLVLATVLLAAHVKWQTYHRPSVCRATGSCGFSSQAFCRIGRQIKR